MLAACMQLSLQGKERLVCSQVPLFFYPYSINLIKDVAFLIKSIHFLREQKETGTFACWTE